MTIAEQLEKKGKAEGIAEGMEKGMAEGMERGKAEVALGLLREGISSEVISKTTGLSIKAIEKLEKR